jgi:hypothetical protein
MQGEMGDMTKESFWRINCSRSLVPLPFGELTGNKVPSALHYFDLSKYEIKMLAKKPKQVRPFLCAVHPP